MNYTALLIARGWRGGAIRGLSRVSVFLIKRVISIYYFNYNQGFPMIKRVLCFLLYLVYLDTCVEIEYGPVIAMQEPSGGYGRYARLLMHGFLHYRPSYRQTLYLGEMLLGGVRAPPGNRIHSGGCRDPHLQLIIQSRCYLQSCKRADDR